MEKQKARDEIIVHQLIPIEASFSDDLLNVENSRNTAKLELLICVIRADWLTNLKKAIQILRTGAF